MFRRGGTGRVLGVLHTAGLDIFRYVLFAASAGLKVDIPL